MRRPSPGPFDIQGVPRQTRLGVSLLGYPSNCVLVLAVPFSKGAPTNRKTDEPVSLTSLHSRRILLHRAEFPQTPSQEARFLKAFRKRETSALFGPNAGSRFLFLFLCTSLQKGGAPRLIRSWCLLLPQNAPCNLQRVVGSVGGLRTMQVTCDHA